MDSSAVVALLVKNDGKHPEAVAALQHFTKQHAELILSNFVVAEIYNLIIARTYPSKAREWLLSNTWPVEAITYSDEKRARWLIEKYADKDFSYTDATSFALMERLEFDLAFTYDQHFRQYGLATQESL
ncbi:MAG: type II toxin-antitoxin system VapC family toxin [Syntrophothermus sp.]